MNWLSKGNLYIVLLLSHFLVSCSVTPKFTKFHANEPKEAFQELIERRESISGFSSGANFEITTPKGKINVRGRINFFGNGKWRIVFVGPMNIELAEINIYNNHYRMTIPAAGKNEEGSIFDPLEIAELNIFLPRLELLTSVLFPVVDIVKQDGWKYHSGESAENGSLEFKRKFERNTEHTKIALSYSPFEIRREERYISESMIFSRWFYYPQNNNGYPNVIDAEIGDVTFKITYNSLTVENRKDGISRRL